MKVGEIYKSNEWGDVQVISYKNSKTVGIRFLNTGNEIITQKWNILRGFVKDSKARNDFYRSLRDASRAERLEQELLQKEERLTRQEDVKSRKERFSRWCDIVRDFKTLFCLEGTLFLDTVWKDRLGFSFTVVNRKDLSPTWLVRYKNTGNEYWCTESKIKSGIILDSDCAECVVLDKYRQKADAAAWYEMNRDERIKYAADYQRKHVEKTRVRNRNRHARRKGAEGSHTVGETMGLLRQQENKCACCHIDLSEDYRHLDHIMPLSLGGSNFIENLQWLCPFCNISKNDTHPDEWEIYSSSDEFKRRRQERLSTAG